MTTSREQSGVASFTEVSTIVMQLLRGLWIWNTLDLLDSEPRTAHLMSSAKAINTTDLYLYVAPTWYIEHGERIAAFLAAASVSNLRVWALDGDRAYVDNLTAQATYFEGLQNLIDFNARTDNATRFHGFQADIEPQDCGDHLGESMTAKTAHHIHFPFDCSLNFAWDC